MKHLINWIEIPVADFDRAKFFYESIFAYQMQVLDMDVLKMGILPSDPGAIGGAICKHPEFYKPGSEGTLIYLNGNPDLDLLLSKVEKAGGKIVFAKRMISPEQGFMAIFIDTEGNRIGLRSEK